ncbi:glycosyltransferase family 2 protein [Butyrivibrio sp. INlla21]|uniref:glycosyltransferase family 2 protein n=1 Tax=Butyrivibrio sp. INlla21 TaxID=1520811 RepID=UPI0008E48874|nr:glycosyltransferase [Butyrivibrio sp. INlla21]SFV02776.1 Glycosyltransferase, GT2 family [Butyrivibrio sp. INlla21]
MQSVAIVFTCFNRKEITKRCLETIGLAMEKVRDRYSFSIYVCDDGSTDGTSEILREYNITVLHGGGLYWNKGMYMAMEEAIKHKHDFYLMINDDVDFYTDSLDIAFKSYEMAQKHCAIVGATKSKKNGVTTYGGQLLRTRKFIDPNGKLQKCDLANWNFFLIDRDIITKLGIIDPNYDHSYGDYDYSLLMKRNGYNIFIATGYIGYCERNTLKNTFKDKALSREERIQRFFSPKGMSIKSGIRYSLKNFDYLGLRGLLLFLGAYLRNLIVVLVG